MNEDRKVEKVGVSRRNCWMDRRAYHRLRFQIFKLVCLNLALLWGLLSNDNIYAQKPNIEYQTVEVSNQPQGRIAFVGSKGEKTEIYVVNADGKNLRQLTSTSGKDSFAYSHLEWSPDGRYLAFISTLEGNWNIFRIKADGSELKQLTFSCCSAPIAYETAFTWSPDGKQIAYFTFQGGNTRLGIMNADGSERHTILSLGTDLSRIDLADPTWSPDGRAIVFTLSPGDKPSGMYIVNTNGSGLRPLSGFIAWTPRWSPDGKHIAYVSDGGGKSEIFVWELEKPQTKQVTTSTKGNNGWPVWSPDGKYIVFTSNLNNTSKINMVNLDTSEIYPLLGFDGSAYFPAWTR